MKTDSFRGRDFITLLDWNKEQVETILDVALDLKRRRVVGELHDHILRAKTLFMVFYNQSLRTRNSFKAGMTQLGGHAHFLDPSKIYTPAMPGKEVAYSTERVSDVARVLARPPEMALDPEVIQACEKYAEMNGAAFEVTDDFMGAADRNWEVEDEVIDNTEPQSGWRSVVYDEAENRLHVQKAVMSLVM